MAVWTRTRTALRIGELRQLAEEGQLPLSGPYRATRNIQVIQQATRDLTPEEWLAVVLELDHMPV